MKKVILLVFISLIFSDNLLFFNFYSNVSITKNIKFKTEKLQTNLLMSFFGPSYYLATNSIFYNSIKFINSANKSIYCSLHELSLIPLANLLILKSKQGVKVEILIESKWLKKKINKFVYNLLIKNGINVILDKKKSGLMHNKYMIIDNEKVWTGSSNFTEHGFFYNFNDSIIINNKDIAKIYFMDFIETTKYYKFKRYKINFKHKYKFGDTKISVYFSPYDYPSKYMIKEIKTAKKNLYFMVFAFSSKNIFYAFKDRYYKKIKIKGIFDNLFKYTSIKNTWNFNPYNEFKKLKISVKYDDENAKVHHKLIIIDQNKVITGSFNFSKNADRNNNENIVIIENKNLNKSYRNRFFKLFNYFPNYSLRDIFEKKYKRATTWKIYKKTYYSFEFKKLNKIIKMKSPSKARIVGVFSGELISVKFPNINEIIKIRLQGVVSPVLANNKYSQYPMNFISRQYLTIKYSRKIVYVKILENTGFMEYKGIVYLDKDKKFSINGDMIKSGMGFLDIPNYKKTKYFKKLLSSENLAKFRKVGIWNKFSKIIHKPWIKKKLYEIHLIDKLKNEKYYSKINFKIGYIIVNKRTSKIYTKNDDNYYLILKNLDTGRYNIKNYLFFKNFSDASKCGYK